MMRSAILITLAVPVSISGAQMFPPACAPSRADVRTFEGVTSAKPEDSTSIEQIGARGNDRVIVKSFGNLRVCIVTDGFKGDGTEQPHDWSKSAYQVLLETQRGPDLRRLMIDSARAAWFVNGASRPVDAATRAWRDDLYAVVDPIWEGARLHERITLLNAEIDAVNNARAKLQEEIDKLEGQAATISAEIANLRGDQSTLRTQIATEQRRANDLQTQIMRERRNLSTAMGAKNRDQSRINQIESNIQRLEDQAQRQDDRIRQLERKLDSANYDRRVVDYESVLKQLNVDNNVTMLKLRIGDLDVDAKVAGIRNDIKALDAEKRDRTLSEKIEQAVARLRADLDKR